MKWLTIDYIKQHSRIDYDNEDGWLEMAGDAAEETILNICNRTYEDLIEVYGQIPAPLYFATLMLVDAGYTNGRSLVSSQQLYTVPGFDMMVKPYVRLTNK